MRRIHKIKYFLTCLTIPGVLFIHYPNVFGQEGSHGAGDDGRERVALKIDAHQCGSADSAKFVVAGQSWSPSSGKDGCGRGAAGSHTFNLKKGETYTLTVQAGDAINPDDGHVSLWWNIWSEDPVLIDGQTTDYTHPVSNGGHPMPEPKYEINTIDPRPMCDTPHDLVDVAYECHHLSTQNGVPCSTNMVIENILVTATCEYHLDRAGVPQCNVNTVNPGGPPELVQNIYENVPCPAQVTNFYLWHKIYFGCTTQCSPFEFITTCPTTPVDPNLQPIRTHYWGRRKFVGCGTP